MVSLSGAVALADGPEITVTQDGAGFSWQAEGNNDGVRLEVNGPGGFHVDEVYGGSSGSFDAGGGPNGAYEFQLTTIPHIDDNVREAMNSVSEEDRAAVEQQLRDAGKIADPVTQGGAFYISGGVIVNSDQDEVDPNKDQIILDDLIVDGSICVGQDCVNGESFGFDTIRLKENNLRIRFVDTSSTSSFPSRDWQITVNDSANGGLNKFSIDDIDGGRTPFTIEGNAPSHSLYVDDGGRLGLGTSTPVVDVHVKSGNTPTLRLEQDGSSGFTPQTWDVAGNEANFFIRDATNGSTLPFRIFPGAPSNALNIEASTGDVGLGTTSPQRELHIEGYRPHLRLSDSNSTSADDVEAFIEFYDRNNSTRAGWVGYGWSQDQDFSITNSTAGGFIKFLTNDQRRVSIDSSGNVGIGEANPSNILTVKQNSTTDPIADAWTTYSSRRWKTNIEPIEGALTKIQQLRGVTYNWKADGKQDIGLIAEEVGEVIPEVVAYEANGIDAISIDYPRLVPLLIESTKEQQSIINDLQQQNAELEARLEKLEQIVETLAQE